MIRIRRILAGTVVTTAVLASVAVFSAWPSVRILPENTAIVKLSFSHGGARACRELTEAERAKLPQNMRRKEVCDRQRAPVYVELRTDGSPTFAASLPPTGLAGDGPSRLYEQFVLPAGTHRFELRLRDTAGEEGFTYTAQRELTLAPGQSLAIDFVPERGGFTFD